MEPAAAAQLPIEGEFPDLDGATTWLNSESLSQQEISVARPDAVRRPHKLSTRSRTAAGWDRNGW
jgi:hypothetical protein